jgi:serine-type D-Ala-D-Ala carboxypeptidase (penicillin-binding protein 5/6)
VKLRNPLIAVPRRAWGAAVVGCIALCAALALAGTSALASARSTKAPTKSPTPVSLTAGTADQSAVGSPATQPRLSAHASILIEESTGQVLYASNAGAELPIASTTKLMTALLTLEHVPRLSTMFTAPEYYAAPGDSQIGLVPGERMSVHDLLLALLIPSADDAAQDLAYNIGGHSVARFVGMMNAQARELGLTQTHYSTPSGLDTPGNYSSATDLVKLSVYLLEHYPWFKSAVKLQHAVLKTGSHPRYVVSTDTLLSEVPWINGVKTGHTADAGYVLVGSGTRDGMTLVSAVLGTDSEASRDANTLALLHFGFSNFRLEHPVVSGGVLARPTVSESPGERVDVLATAGVSEMVARTARLTTRVDVPRQLAGPLPDHALVGTAVVSDGAHVLARVPVELSRALPAVSELTIVGRFFSRPTTLVLLVLLIGGASVLVRRRRGGGRPQPTTQVAEIGAPQASAPEPAAVAAAVPGQEAADERAAALERAATAERSAAAERERRRAEREARRRASDGDPARSSARDRA